MRRALAIAFLAAAGLTAALPLAAAPSLSLVATVTPAHAPPLMPIVVSIGLISRSPDYATVVYPSPELFFIQIRDAEGKPVYDSRTGHTTQQLKRTMRYNNGLNKLASFDWDTLGDTHRALSAPASYTIHVEMQTVDTTLTANLPLVIDPPATIGSILAGTPGAPATIVGVPERSGSVMMLRDDTGVVALSHPLGISPRGRFLVRGYLQRAAAGTSFVIDRFAPAAENTDPQGTPTPRVFATPT